MSVYYLFTVIQVNKRGEDVAPCSKKPITYSKDSNKSECESSMDVCQCAKNAQEEMMVGRFVTLANQRTE